jgi:predicted ATP-dependent Lon-type protease
MVPFVENNYNCCELRPRGTGKSHIDKEISPNSILISGGQTTVANLFYNMARRTVGLVGPWDVVAFDEVAGIHFTDKDGVQIMKDFMASGSFARGRDAIQASASMVFLGNINQPVDTLVKTSHLLAPFPETMIDSVFFDRFHAYIPGWEVPKMRPELFTNQYGLITDYLAEFMREMRKRSFADALDRYFKLGRDLNQRDTIAVRRTVSGLLKLLYPHGEYDKEAVKVAFDYFKANISRVSGLAKAGDHDYHLHTVELHNTGATKAMTLPGFVALCSGILQKPVQGQMVVLGDMSLGGSVIPVENLAECLQVAFDSGAKRILLPMASVGDIPSIPGELFAKFQTSFYADPVDPVFKALGVE